MKTRDNFPALTLTWLALVALTLISLGLGEWFLESRNTHPFIARLLKGFIIIAPVALILTAFFGATFARWATL